MPGPPAIITADSGCTSNYASLDCPVLNKRPTSKPIQVQNPNGSVMTSTHEAEFDLPMLRPEARRAHIVPQLHNCSLLSIDQLTDSGYIAVFDAKCLRIFDSPTIEAIDSTKCILTGTRHCPTGMWHIDAPCRPIQTHLANRIGAPTTEELVAFAHATLFSPALTTLEEALTEGWVTNFPGLTAASLRRHPPASIPMDKGHMDQTRQNQRSTKPKHIAPTATIPAFYQKTTSNLPVSPPKHITVMQLLWSPQARSIQIKPVASQSAPAEDTNTY